LLAWLLPCKGCIAGGLLLLPSCLPTSQAKRSSAVAALLALYLLISINRSTTQTETALATGISLYLSIYLYIQLFIASFPADEKNIDKKTQAK